MGTYALGAFLAENEGRTASERVAEVIRELRNQGKLRALPIVSTNKATGTLLSSSGIELREYGAPGSGRWVPVGAIAEGTIKYLGSATHAGHIELKALCVYVEDRWYNIITSQPELDSSE